MQLLAKDGIYIADFPRRIDVARVPAGGRADVMIRCASRGRVAVTSEGKLLSTIAVSGEARQSDPMAAWSPPRAAYLADLRDGSGSSRVDPSCSCETRFEVCAGSGIEGCVNGRRFAATEYIHAAPLGKVHERRVGGLSEHPYHQHAHPFQLFGGFQDATGYFKHGDWHDTWQDNAMAADQRGVLRFRPVDFGGRMLVHCHWNLHQDDGMMASELVGESDSGCACEAWLPAPAARPPVGGYAPGSVRRLAPLVPPPLIHPRPPALPASSLSGLRRGRGRRRGRLLRRHR